MTGSEPAVGRGTLAITGWRCKVVSIDNILVEGNEVQFSVRCEAGTYVKELVHSDEGRTVPSVTSVLERACEVIWLDVEDIHAD